MRYPVPFQLKQDKYSDPPNANGLNLVTEYRYDNLNRVVQVINPAGQSIEYMYDDWGNIASTNQVDMGRVDYSYDKHGFLRFSQTREQRQRGRVLSRQYDALGRVTMISEASIGDLPKGDQPVLPMVDPDALHIGVPAVHGPYVNHTHVQPSTQQIPTIYKPQNAFLPTQGMVTLNTPCPDLLAEAASNRFNPAQMPMTTVIERDVTTFQPRMISASTNDFENAALYPEFILQSIWYDELPPQQGAVWGGVPPANVWNKLATHGTVRNLLGRPSTVAYRTDASQPFHYITRSYDERGRVECILRLTENIGYDAVYYAYNSSNSIISVHVVDARGQHATFYGYDQEGRVCKTWTRSSADGFGPFMEPRRPKLLTLERDGVSQQPVAEYQYNLLNQVSLVTYPKISVTSTNTYNAAGALLRSTTQQGQRPYYDEAFSYSRGGMITDKFFTQDGESRHETYGYDQAARLMSSFERAWPGSPMFGVAADQTMYQYDAAGNRTEVFRETRVNNAYLPLQSQYYTHTPGTNQLTRVSDVPMVNGGTAGNPTFDDVLTYDPDGSMISRTKNRVEGGFASQSIEEYTYDAFNLVRGYRVRRASVPVDGLSACRPDASTSPADVWSYRFGPLQEREQKRQLVSSADTTLAWVYTLVGADGRQLATYNGLQGSMCGRNGVRLWPVEFNTYGPNNTRIITRADGTSEVVISDYLGSARVTLSTTAEPLQSSSYHPYGTERTSTGSGARTSYIGREHDKETDLGFYGVRLYEPEYGRFLSTDVLWSKYLPLQPYQYAGNNPVMALDYGGDTIVFLSEKAREQYTVAKEHIISSYPEAASYFSTVENAEDHFIFRTNGNGLNSFEPLATDDGAYQSTSEKRVHGINWDPGHAANLGSMGSLSPSMILFHEILHAAGQVEGGASSEDDGTKLTSPEERRVIAIENAAAKKLGQAARDCHNCAEWEYFVVKNPTEGGSPASEPEQKPTKNSPSTRDQPR